MGVGSFGGVSSSVLLSLDSVLSGEWNPACGSPVSGLPELHCEFQAILGWSGDIFFNDLLSDLKSFIFSSLNYLKVPLTKLKSEHLPVMLPAPRFHLPRAPALDTPFPPWHMHPWIPSSSKGEDSASNLMSFSPSPLQFGESLSHRWAPLSATPLRLL